MKNRERHLWASLLLTSLCLSSFFASFAQDNETSGSVAVEVKQLIDKQIEAQSDEKIAHYMKTIHPESPTYKQTETGTKELFDVYDLETKLRSFRFIGRDKTYAVARVATETSKITGPQFKNNLIDVMHILKKHKGKWKVFSTAILGYRRTKEKVDKKKK